MNFLNYYPLILFISFLLYVIPCNLMNMFPRAKDFEPNGSILKVACVGDSITQGDGTKFTPFLSYPAELQRLVDKKYSIRNFGKNSATVMFNLPDSYVEHPFYQQVLNNNPNIIILMLGTNDSKTDVWKDAKTFTKYYTKILDSFATLPSQPRIILMTPPKAYKPDLWDTCFYSIRDTIIKNEIIPAIKLIAEKRKLEFIDIYSLTDNHRVWFIYDGIHPDVIGCRAIAQAVSKKLL